MSTLELDIEGMSCIHCVKSVRNELQQISGVHVEVVEIGKARITMDEDTVSRQTIEEAVIRAGYVLKAVR